MQPLGTLCEGVSEDWISQWRGFESSQDTREYPVDYTKEPGKGPMEGSCSSIIGHGKICYIWR